MDDDPPILKFDEHCDAAAEDTRVRCPKCRKRIFMHATQCEYCGIHFEGEAWEFSPSIRQNSRTAPFGIPGWVLAVVATIVLVALLLSMLL